MIALTIILLVSAQVMYKKAAIWSLHYPGATASFIQNPWLAVGLICAATAMITWLLALQQISLSIAYPWTALIYVLTPIASAIVFDDKLKPHVFIGLALISMGVLITTRAAKNDNT